jgi:hypothetical protein
MKIAERAIAAALAPLRFQMQSDPNSVNFVRRNAATAHLFEWVECVYVGRPPHTIVLSVALSAVQHGVLQFRGLLARDGWPEMCTDPENGRVAFQRREEVAEWLARLADQAPERFERLVREKGDTFLAITKEARERVGVVADTIVPRRALADALREPFAGLTEEETKLAKALMRLPQVVVSSEELWSVHGVAIAALIRFGDDAIAQAVNAPTPIDPIMRLQSVPVDLIWRIRLLVDRILIWRDESDAVLGLPA